MSHPSFCEVASGRIAYSRQGNGPCLVLLHPIGVDRSWWGEYVHEWQQAYDVIEVDFRGHGDSSSLLAPITLSEHAADVVAVLRQERVSSAHIIGVSMGGMVAQRIAIEVPGIAASLILCATAGGFPDAARPRILARGDLNRTGSMSEVVDDTVARWFRADSPRPDLVKRCRARLLADDWYSWSANWAAISQLDNLTDLARVTAPALVVAGDMDAGIPPAASKLIADAIPGATFVSIPSASHFGAFEMRESFVPVFDKFLSTQVP
jgi:3-oxoadipate enol-lactonase